MHARSAAVLTAILLTCTAPVALAKGTSYKGKTSQNRTITLSVSGGKVTKFSGGVNMGCGQSGIEFNAAIPPKAMAVKGGKFSYKGRDKIDSVNLEISGTVKASKVTGKLRMTDSRYNASDQTYDACVGSATFTATKK